jgi:DNA replication and repair protein RecF
LGGSEERRKFIDGVISQYDQVYLADLMKYNHALVQRNNLLRQFAANHMFDSDLLLLYDEQLAEYGGRIHAKRSEFVRKLIPVFQQYYSLISQDSEKVSLVHESALYQNNLSDLLKSSVGRDRALQYTTQGIHKDDLVFYIGDFPIRKLGSQGQMKTYLISLKLAQFDFIREISGIRPMLLLDDIFDKLDQYRVEEIVKIVAGDQFGQIFITDTNRSHLESIIRKMDTDFRIFNVEDGNIKSAE